MRRSLILLLIILCTMLAGCSAQAGGQDSTTPLRIWYSTDDPVERAWTHTISRRFETTHPDIRVNLTDYSFADLNTKLQLALSSGKPPDLAYVTPRGPGIPAYVSAHQLRDLTGDARLYHWASRLRPGLLAAYNRPFAFLGEKPNHVVAVPSSLAAVAILCNTRLLHALHMQLPSNLAAFETLLARARAHRVTPIGMGNADGWLGDDWYLTLVNALLSPSTLQNEQRLDPHFSFRQPPFLRAARILSRWAQRGYFTPDFGGLDAQEGLNEFFRGTTLFQLISSSENPQLLSLEKQTRLPISVFAFPSAHGKPVMPLSGYLGWVIPTAGHRPSAAASFIDYMVSQPIARFLAVHAVLPAVRQHRNFVSARTWHLQYVQALNTAQPGVYLDAAPIANLNATMEANVQLLLQGYEPPEFLVKSLQDVYASHGQHGSTARIDGEF